MNQKLQLLAATLKTVSQEEKRTLDDLKSSYDDINRADFLWHYLLQSFSTMGRSAGWHGLIGNKINYNRVTFGALSSLNDIERKDTVHEVCRAAKVRMPAQKAEFILRCFKQIEDLGGLQRAKNQLLNLEGRNRKIKFLKQFHGIGDKYARNIMMDVYHEDFRDSIAIDVRIKAISELLGLDFSSYDEEENFYLEAAKIAGLNGWEVDRLLYNFRDEFERLLSKVA